MVGAGDRRLCYQRPAESDEMHNQEHLKPVCNFKQKLTHYRKMSQKTPPLKKQTHERSLSPLSLGPGPESKAQISTLERITAFCHGSSLRSYSPSWFSSMNTSSPGSLLSAGSQCSCRHLSFPGPASSFQASALGIFSWHGIFCGSSKPLCDLWVFLSFT